VQSVWQPEYCADLLRDAQVYGRDHALLDRQPVVERHQPLV
jgi:hypothetical protein